MKILRLELQGFKSFMDKTVIQFNQPITAIVGSNGCGKSNVVDAMYWVMGDMSPKHLRGSNMTDVIFSGTKSKTALDMAEVTLVLERNPETDPALAPQFQGIDEVQITRRYYRHGESEYFINRVPCRLRDIQEFFMDTGIGAKSYSIIEQGAITRMVAQKPEERRLVIEDVAGITKFKARRAETERKLEQSKLNLQRVDDLVKDLQKQLISLQRQADKAQKFKEWGDELRELEIRVAGGEWVSRRERLGKSKGESEITTSRLAELEEKLASAKAELLDLKQLSEQKDHDLDLLRRSRQDQELQVKDVESKIQSLETKEETLRRRKESDEKIQVEVQRRLVELAQALSELGLALRSTELQSTEQISAVEDLRHNLDQARMESEGLRKEAEAEQRRCHDFELKSAKLSQEIQADQSQTLQLEDRQSQILEIRGELDRELQLRRQEKDGAERLLQSAFAERKDLESQKEEIDGKIQAFDEELSRESEALLASQEKLTRDKLRLQHLQELESNLEGIGSASRSLALYLKEQEGNLTPIIADQIKVPELLERAVEAALGDSLETIVVNRYSEVKHLLDYLKSNASVEAKSARVKFFVRESLPSITAPQPAPDVGSPFTIVPEAPGPDNVVSLGAVGIDHRSRMSLERYLREHPAVVGNLMELLSRDTQVAEWAGIYSSWWIVRDRGAFELLRPSIDSRVTLVTLDGDVSHPNGFLDLAPVEENPDANLHLMQRKRELEQLKIRVEEQSSVVLRGANRVEEIKKQLSVEREAYKLLTQRLVALNPGLQKHTDLIRELEGRLGRLSEKSENLIQEFDQNQAKLSKLKVLLADRNSDLIRVDELLRAGRSDLAIKQEALAVVEARIKVLALELEGRQKTYSDTLKKLTLQKTEEAGLFQEQNLSETRLAQLDQDLKDVAAQLEEIQRQREELARHRSEVTEKLAHFQSEEIRVDAELRKVRADVSGREATLSQLQSDLKTQFEILKSLEQDTAVNEVEIRNIEERILSQYQVALSSLPSEELSRMLAPLDLEENLNPEVNREKISRLKGKIDRLGKINMVAMEEYQELARRYEYLFVQRQDLAEAIKSLFEAIARIDQESRDRFKESFEAVNVAFQKTFPIMFGGGHAELKLTDPENLLESGVEIVAQPPGKKLQSVTLLSGGEKALTAVSLIFGIFSIKPSPFAVLDEVDAPLDDTNVGRFNKQVRSMSERSQIILITHHKKSMESADALYGVTMEEPGISKVASAKLGRI